MIRIPQLRGKENVFTRNTSVCKSCPQGLGHLTLVPVSLHAIEVSKSSFQGVSGCIDRDMWVGNQGAKAESGHFPRSVVEWHSGHPQIRGFNH
jgi:hypothetical protein